MNNYYVRKENDKITKMLSDCKKVWVVSDLHLIKYDKESGRVYHAPDYDEKIEALTQISDGDGVIFLGDLVDSEITDINLVSKLYRSIIKPRCATVLIRGNNDCFEDAFYIDGIGFDAVVYGLLIGNIFLSHTSIPIDGQEQYWNVHGHIHRYNCNINDIPYYHPCERNVNICGACNHIIEFNELQKNIAMLADYNNSWIKGKTEKPGMSQFVQNMAMQTFYNLI